MIPDSAACAYQRCCDLLERRGLLQYVEPLEHVMAVEELRRLYRPRHIRLLLVAESHVRSGTAKFEACGPAYLYNHRYYTPWWRHLLSPAYRFDSRTTVESRKRDLAKLRELGFWVLDASLLALSGYRKLNPEWPNRPLDSWRKELMDISWQDHVLTQFLHTFDQHPAPALVVMESVSEVIPQRFRSSAMTLRFPERANADTFSHPEYKFGTAMFQRAVNRSLEMQDESLRLG